MFTMLVLHIYYTETEDYEIRNGYQTQMYMYNVIKIYFNKCSPTQILETCARLSLTNSDTICICWNVQKWILRDIHSYNIGSSSIRFFIYFFLSHVK